MVQCILRLLDLDAEGGATMAEYALLVTLIATVVAVAASMFGTTAAKLFELVLP